MAGNPRKVATEYLVKLLSTNDPVDMARVEAAKLILSYDTYGIYEEPARPIKLPPLPEGADCWLIGNGVECAQWQYKAFPDGRLHIWVTEFTETGETGGSWHHYDPATNSIGVRVGETPAVVISKVRSPSGCESNPSAGRLEWGGSEITPTILEKVSEKDRELVAKGLWPTPVLTPKDVSTDHAVMNSIVADAVKSTIPACETCGAKGVLIEGKCRQCNPSGFDRIFNPKLPENAEIKSRAMYGNPFERGDNATYPMSDSPAPKPLAGETLRDFRARVLSTVTAGADGKIPYLHEQVFCLFCGRTVNHYDLCDDCRIEPTTLERAVEIMNQCCHGSRRDWKIGDSDIFKVYCTHLNTEMHQWGYTEFEAKAIAERYQKFVKLEREAK